MPGSLPPAISISRQSGPKTYLPRGNVPSAVRNLFNAIRMAGQPVVSRSHENAAATHVYHYRDAAMDVLSLEKRDPLPPSSITRLFWMHGSSDDVCPRCWRILDSTAGDLSRTLSDFGTRRISENDTFQRSQRESRHVDNLATRNSNFT